MPESRENRRRGANKRNDNLRRAFPRSVFVVSGLRWVELFLRIIIKGLGTQQEKDNGADGRQFGGQIQKGADPWTPRLQGGGAVTEPDVQESGDYDIYPPREPSRMGFCGFFHSGCFCWLTFRLFQASPLEGDSPELPALLF